MGFDYRRDASGIVIVTMDMDGQAANTMSPVYHNLMGSTVVRLEMETNLTGVIFASAKKTFFAGGDLNELLKADTGDAAYEAWLNEDKGYLRRLEKLSVPVVAAINGAALGGGFEICLACNHRIIVDDPKALIGLPEVTLGLLPGAGGVTRLPKILTLGDALDLLLSGRVLQPSEARDLNLVDATVPTTNDLIPAAIAWIEAHPNAHAQPWDCGPRALSTSELTKARARIATARVDVEVGTRGKLPAPKRILDIMERGLELNIDETLKFETKMFASLIGLPETRAAISTNFFATNAIRSGKLRPLGERTRITRLVVIGAGNTANAIAKTALARGIETQSVKPGAQISTCEMILDASQDEAPDRKALIRVHFGTLAPDGIYGIHTTGQPVEPDFDACPEPSQLFGFHVPAPSGKTRLVEIVQGAQTSTDTIRRAYDFFQQIGKTPIIVKDVPGFYMARVTSAYVNEGLALLVDGLEPDILEDAAYEAGMALPPLRQLDEMPVSGTGLELSHQNELQVRIIRTMSDLHRTGRAAGRGFYDYAKDGTRTLWPELSRFRDRQETITPKEAVDRMLYIQVIETVRCLNEGVLGSREEADLGAIMGFGFPRHTGGTIQFIKGIGPEVFAARSGELAARWGDRFQVSGEIFEKLRQGADKAA